MNLCIRGFNPLISPVLLLALSVWIAVSAQAAAAQTKEPEPASVESKSSAVRRVNVQVTVTCDAKPVAEVPFTVQYDRAFSQGVTDADGQVVLEVDVPTSARMVAVYPRPPLPPPGTRTPVFLWHQQEYLRLIAPYAFANWYRVELRPNEGSYELTIEVSRARQVTLHVETPEPDSRAITISRGSTNKLNRPDADCRVVVAGLPKEEPSVIYVMSSLFQGRVARVEVPAGQADADFGAVLAPSSSPADCEVRIASNWSTPHLWSPESRVGGLSLASLDGRTVLTMLHSPNFPHAVFNQGSPALPRVPSGEYYVIGGLFGGTLAQTSVIERARAGEDLRKLGVPTIIAVPDRVAEFELDQWGVERIILGGEDNTDRPELVLPKP